MNTYSCRKRKPGSVSEQDEFTGRPGEHKNPLSWQYRCVMFRTALHILPSSRARRFWFHSVSSGHAEAPRRNEGFLVPFFIERQTLDFCAFKPSRQPECSLSRQSKRPPASTRGKLAHARRLRVTSSPVWQSKALLIATKIVPIAGHRCRLEIYLIIANASWSRVVGDPLDREGLFSQR
jgi:hypothetical protein